MAAPAIVWRNPKSVQRRRVWSHVKRDACRSLYVVVESASTQQYEWKGLPNLEIIRGGGTTAAREARENRSLPSRA
jgi:hypothetical protein